LTKENIDIVLRVESDRPRSVAHGWTAEILLN